MKKIMLFSFLSAPILAAAIPQYKQQMGQYTTEERFVHEYVWQRQMSRSMHKSTAVMKRLIATAYSANGFKVDSTRYWYSNGRGSQHTVPETYFNIYYLTSYKQNQNIKCDSLRYWNSGSGTNLLWQFTGTYVYNSHNKVTATKYLSPYITYENTALYNTQGNLRIVGTLDTFGGTAMIPKSNMFIVYDTYHRRILDSTVDIYKSVQTGKHTYEYDTAGNLLVYSAFTYKNNNWEIFFRHTFSYDSQDRVVTDVTEVDYGNGLVNQSKDSFAYSGTAVHPVFHSIDTWVDSTQVWDPYEMFSFNLNANGLPADYIIYRHINQWDTIERDVYTYDGNDLLVKANGYLHTGNGTFSTVPYDGTNFYYEEYYPNDISESHKKDKPLSIYPNPAKDYMVIDIPSAIDVLQVTDVQGRVVSVQNDLPQGSYKLDVSRFIPGNYVISVRDREGGIKCSIFTKKHDEN